MPDLRIQAFTTVLLVLFAALWYGGRHLRRRRHGPVALQSLNDFQYILLEFEVFPLSLWAIAIGFSIILDQSERPVFPRWVAWVNFWFSGLVMTGQFMIFFKEGPMAWNGLLAVYWPAFVFFFWICAMSTFMIIAIKREVGVTPNADTQHYL